MRIRIPRPRGITTGQLMILTAVNVFAGIYIWQPLVLQHQKEIAKQNSSTESVPETKSPPEEKSVPTSEIVSDKKPDKDSAKSN